MQGKACRATKQNGIPLRDIARMAFWLVSPR